MPLRDPNSPASKLNHRIRNIFSTAVAEHFRKHPEIVKDPVKFEAAKQEIKPLFEIMQDVLDAVNAYRIGAPDDPCDPPT